MKAHMKRAKDALADAQKTFDAANRREEFDDVAVMSRADLARVLDDLERATTALEWATEHLTLLYGKEGDPLVMACREALAPKRPKVKPETDERCTAFMHPAHMCSCPKHQKLTKVKR